jgi:ssDNA-binding Zn-finger/Zn-ribbon topoisomerase 1
MKPEVKRKEVEGKCIVCGSKTLNQFGTRKGYLVYCCEYPKKCKLVLHDTGILY